jgi:dihydrofolate reductase
VVRHDGRVPKTQYYTATTVDGFIADPHDSLDWLFDVPRDGGSGYDAFREFFAEVGAMAMGATTYQGVVDHEGLVDEPEKWAGWYGTTPCWVFTHRELPTLPDVDIRFVQGEVRPVHETMTEAAGNKNIWLVGGGELVGAFADAGLLDEIWLGMQPVFLGAGAPLLPRVLTSKRVKLESARKDGQQVLLRFSVSPLDPSPAARADP